MSNTAPPTWEELSPENQKWAYEYNMRESAAWSRMYWRQYDQNTLMWLVLIAIGGPGLWQIGKWIWWLIKHVSISFV